MPDETNKSALYDMLLDRLPDYCVFLLDASGVIMEWNDAVGRMFGYAREDLVGRHISVIFAEEDRKNGVPDREIHEAVTRREAADVRWHFRKDGTPMFIDALLVALRDESGQVARILKIVRDITPHHMIGGLLHPLTESLDEPVMLRDRDGRFAFVNSAAAQVIGQSKEKLIRKRPEEVWGADLARRWREVDEKIFADGKGREFEVDLDVNGGRRSFSMRQTAWHDENGRIVGMVAVARDITGRKELARQREELLKRLQYSNEELSEFSRVVSHDLRAPLKTIGNYARLLSRKYKGRLDESADDFLSFITDAAGRAQEMIAGLLDLAQTGDTDPDKRTMQAASALEAALDNLRAAIEETGAELHYENLPTVKADHLRLTQVFQNLIGNAIQYRKPETPPRIVIDSQDRGSEWEFRVQDNGIGIPRDSAEKIFLPLKRLHGLEVPGSGLGLAVCRKIIERHGGWIWAESQPGRGSTFHFTLPKV